MTDKRGFSVKIFIPNGEPEGLRIVEKSNWTGQGIAFPRSLMSDARQRPEVKGAGVYVLWGPADSGQLPVVYVGEGESVLPRLDSHVRNKDFWTQAIVFISKDQNLNKAHVQYLEARLVEMAASAKRCQLDNGNVPQCPVLSEADAADAEGFLADILLCLPVMGVNFFERSTSTRKKGPSLYLKAKGLKASGRESSEGFVVMAGSQAILKAWPSVSSSVCNLRDSLVQNGVLQLKDKTYVFTQDYTFSSPSMPCSVILGRNGNGRTNWKDKDGRTLKELQEAQTEQV